MSSDMGYVCPVCGYVDFDEPPWSGDGLPSYDICPSCGVEFGYHDFAQDEVERRERWRILRQKWIENGMRWSSSVEPPPPDWDPVKQLTAIGVDITG
jgi:rubredoxin